MTRGQGILIRHGMPCPKCPSSDAYAEYSNNFYCFSCHYSKQKEGNMTSKSIATLNPHKYQVIPNNAYPVESIEGLSLLYKYMFTDALIAKYNIMEADPCPIWSKRLNGYFTAGHRLILPYYEQAVPIYAEYRALDNADEVKYYSLDKTRLFKTFFKKRDKIVVVESILDAMRVGEVFPTVALRGTNCNHEKIVEIYRSADSYILWLDSDKAGREALAKLKNKLGWGGSVDIIQTPKDPKCYTNEEIKRYIDECLA